MGSGCYAELGPLGLHWKHVTYGERGDDFTSFLADVRELPRGQIWRHNQAGDLPGKGTRISRVQLRALANASAHTRGFTYTHKPVEGDSKVSRENREAIKEANSEGFTINLSADNLEHADRLHKMGIAPVTTVVPMEETRPSFRSPGGNMVTVCPAVLHVSATCSTCELCAHPTRKSIVAFPVHGTRKGRMSERLRVVE